MRSLRTRITLLTVFVVLIALTAITLLSVIFIRNSERREARQMMLLLCETGEQNLDYYFNSVQKSVEKVASFVEADLNGLDDERFSQHMKRAEQYFDKIANKTSGVLTYYYRVDPDASETVKGFWYTNLDGDGFKEHEVTDIKRYDTQDTSKLVWFTVPKHTGNPVWLPPYITDNLDVRVISYNTPIYWKGQFVGVVGIELDYTAMAEQVDSIRLYSNGFAFLSDAEGNLFFHPRIDVSQLDETTMPAIPDGAIDASTFLEYTFEGVEKQAAWLPLSNGMRLVVSVPVEETEGDWQKLVREIIVVALIVLLVMSAFTMLYTRRITRPLEELTEAAEKVNQGNYDFMLEYNENDEVGRLTSTFKRLADHMKEHINDLSKRAYVDALTSVKNKGAFSNAIEELQKQMDADREKLEYAIGVFDCDDLKAVNDAYGHDKGDVYLKTACKLICRIFAHSPVYRIGGDEFAVILRNQDYANRAELIRRFEQESRDINAENEVRWQQVRAAVGLAEYDPKQDCLVVDTVRRADKSMYLNKHARKDALKRKAGAQ